MIITYFFVLYIPDILSHAVFLKRQRYPFSSYFDKFPRLFKFFMQEKQPVEQARQQEIPASLNPQHEIFELHLFKVCAHRIDADETLNAMGGREQIR